MKLKTDLIDAIILELEMQKDYLPSKSLDTIYFGGGTPSILSKEELDRIFEKIYAIYDVKSDAEITLEANPDDLSLEKLKELKQTPINRLSIGVQSFFDTHLTWMNRSHKAGQARRCISDAQSVGFSNLTVDLIYGLPDLSNEQWAENIQILLDFEIPHISCYCLTVEKGTALGHFVKTGKSKPVDDEKSSHQFEYLMEKLSKNRFEHYEISNFAKDGNYAKHNTAYWQGDAYLGIGPGAHSYDGLGVRQWNLEHNSKYIKSIQSKILPFEKEMLSKDEKYNEYIMISLRTMWGANEDRVVAFGSHYWEHFKAQVADYLSDNLMIKDNGHFILTKKGRLFADKIAMELFA